jgi:hypothetical protein
VTQPSVPLAFPTWRDLWASLDGVPELLAAAAMRSSRLPAVKTLESFEFSFQPFRSERGRQETDAEDTAEGRASNFPRGYRASLEGHKLEGGAKTTSQRDPSP